jgi:hypothetical protein
MATRPGREGRGDPIPRRSHAIVAEGQGARMDGPERPVAARVPRVEEAPLLILSRRRRYDLGLR